MGFVSSFLEDEGCFLVASRQAKGAQDEESRTRTKLLGGDMLIEVLVYLGRV